MVAGNTTNPGAQAASISEYKAPVHPPNVIMIMLDDLGLEQMSVYDDCNQWSSYPYYPGLTRVNKLAADGLRFRRFYAGVTCTPTRSMIYTGRNIDKTLMSSSILTGGAYKLKSSWVTLPDAVLGVSNNFYRWRHFGKWHLGFGLADFTSPQADGGVQRYHGCPTNLSLDGQTGYGGTAWDPIFGNATTWTSYNSNASVHGQGQIVHGDAEAQDIYNPQQEKDDLLDWIGTGNNPTRPFVGIWWMHTPHAPLHWAPTALHTMGVVPAAAEVGALNSHMTMMESADTLIGQLIDGMPPDTLANTVFIILGDNGTLSAVVDPNGSHGTGAEFPATAVRTPPDVYTPAHFKGSSYEGGVHCPLIISGPGIRPGVTDTLVSVVDLFATILELTAHGWEKQITDPIDSKSLVPLFSNAKAEIHDFITVSKYSPPGTAITDSSVSGLDLACWKNTGDYKLRISKNLATDPIVQELFKLGKDPTARLDPHEGTLITPSTAATDYLALRNHIQTTTSLVLTDLS